MTDTYHHDPYGYKDEDELYLATGPLPDDEPEHDEDVDGALAEVRRAA